MSLGLLGLSAATILASRKPSLINAPGITTLDGLSLPGPDFFNENMPLRDGVELTVGLADGTTQLIKSPVTNTVVGAMAIQEVFDNWEWVSQPGNPVAYAPHLQKAPLPGVPAKPVIIQFAKGDQFFPNPTTTAFLRAGDLADRATYYRYDLAFPQYQQDPNNLLAKTLLYPHTFVGLITNPNQIIKAVALGAQQQIATFFDSDGQFIDDLANITTPDGKHLFEVPIQGPLPEGLNYTNPPPASAAAETQVSGSQASDPIPTDAALTVPQAALAVPVPLADPSATPISPLIDVTLDALPPLAAELLRPARRRR